MWYSASQVDLHPIMFLLNQKNLLRNLRAGQYLHPIMFLLNLNSCIYYLLNVRFTSHYVPIKSKHKCLKQKRVAKFTSHYVPIKSHTYIILYFLRFSTPFLSTPEKTSQVDVRNLLNYLLTTLLTPHESMDCQLPHKNALS